MNSRIPVIIGVGQVNDRDAATGVAGLGLDSLGLMEAALRAADRDAGGGWLSRLDSLAVVEQISCPELGDVSAPLARALAANPRICYKTAYSTGDAPLLLLNEAANRIASGEVTVAAVVGGEALRTAARRASASGADGGHPMPSATVALRRGPSYRQRYGLTAPVDVYPLYENALRAAYGQTLAQGQAESAQIWSLFSEVASANEGAWLRRAVSPEEIQTVSASNRPIAFPYSKLMVANLSVNQGAGFLVTSLSEARARGVGEEQLVFVGRGAAAREPADFLARANFSESPSMTISLRRALELNGLVTEDLDYAELYSCFPCVPKMARRIIGWPLSQTGQRIRRIDLRRRTGRKLHESCCGQHGIRAAPRRPLWIAVRERRSGHAESLDDFGPHGLCGGCLSAEFRLSNRGGLDSWAGAAHARRLPRPRRNRDLHSDLRSRGHADAGSHRCPLPGRGAIHRKSPSRRSRRHQFPDFRCA